MPIRLFNDAALPTNGERIIKS